MSARLAAPLACAALAALLVLPPARGAALRELDVEKNSSRYYLVADAYMEAPAEAIFEVLVDYERLHRISSAYKESGYLDPAPDGTPVVYTRLEGCLAFFCRSVRRVERLEAEAPHYIQTTAVPGESDVKHSRSEWRLEPEGEGTRVIYELEMEPDFWVPPVVGPWFLKRRLRDGGARAVERIERLAQDVAVATAD